MTTGRFLLEAVLLGLVCAAAVVALEAWFGLSHEWVVILVLAPGLCLLMLSQKRRKIARRDHPNPERQHVPLIQLAVGGWVFVIGMALVSTQPEGALGFWVGTVAWLLGLAVAVPGASAQMRQAQAARHDPAQVDERAKANQTRSQGWGFVAMLQVALIGGLVDMNGIWALSGAAVGFAAGSAGVLVGLTGQAYLEWRDAR